MKNRNNVTLRLVLDVTYDLNGTSVEYLKTELQRAPSLLVANGLLSGDSPAQVNDFNSTVSENTMNQPHNDKRSPSTDALETLGMIHYKPEKRDAIHLAVEPVMAGTILKAGQPIGVINGVAYPVGHVYSDNADTPKTPYQGIVDPFLPHCVHVGEKFWFVMAPRMVQSLRHVWEHPDFPPGT